MGPYLNSVDFTTPICELPIRAQLILVLSGHLAQPARAAFQCPSENEVLERCGVLQGLHLVPQVSHLQNSAVGLQAEGSVGEVGSRTPPQCSGLLGSAFILCWFPFERGVCKDLALSYHCSYGQGSHKNKQGAHLKDV